MKNLKRIKLKKYIYVTFQEIWAEQVASFSLKPPSGPEADFVLSNLGKRKLEVWWQTQPCLDLSLALSPLSLTRRLPQRSWSTITTILLITLLDVILPFLFTIFIPGPLSSAVPHDRLPRLGWRRHLVGSYLHLLFISVLYYMCSNCIPDKVVHAGHDNLALDLLRGLPQLCGTLCTYIDFLYSCISSHTCHRWTLPSKSWRIWPRSAAQGPTGTSVTAPTLSSGTNPLPLPPPPSSAPPRRSCSSPRDQVNQPDVSPNIVFTTFLCNFVSNNWLHFPVK